LSEIRSTLGQTLGSTERLRGEAKFDGAVWIPKFGLEFELPGLDSLCLARADSIGQTESGSMSANSKIEWTDATWNPVRGCTKVSPGCLHCYAETFAERFRGVPGHPFEFGFDLRLVPEKLGDPLRWSRPKKVFVNSMSDLFHERVPDDYIEKVCRVMLAANWHTYQSNGTAVVSWVGPRPRWWRACRRRLFGNPSGAQVRAATIGSNPAPDERKKV
jgi:Protein of unknown function (DUF5131)